MSHINEYYQTDWIDKIFNIHFTPEQINEAYILDSIINLGHQGTGNVFFRWKLLTDGKISYHGLNTRPISSINNQYTYASFSLEINDNNIYGIKAIANRTVFLAQTDKKINHTIYLQIRHIGSGSNFRTCFNTSFGHANEPKNSFVASTITLYEIEKMKMSEFGNVRVYH